MQYTLLFGLTPDEFAARTAPETQRAFYGAFMPYLKAIREAGIFVNGAGLQIPSTATTVRLKNGKRQVQDGPFADTKEQIGGFVVIDVPDLDSALSWAARYPCEEGGLVEVRPNLPTTLDATT